MKQISQSLSAVLTAFLLVGFVFGGVVDSEAARKAKFRYDKPDMGKWMDYCDARHPKMPLVTCCSRRTGSCESRCKKSRFPNTAYQTKGQCISACRDTRSTCDRISLDRYIFKKSLEGFRQCKRIRNVVSHNVCCREQAVECNGICSLNFKEGERKFEQCIEQCSKRQKKSCIKKFSKRQYSKMKKKVHDSQWMNTYCSNKKNLKGRDKKGCCKTMKDRCYADCDGRPDSPKAISACKHRCIKANNICKDSK